MTIAKLRQKWNKSGIHPAGDRVLVKPDSIEKLESQKIEIPDTVLARYEQGQSTGTLIDVGPDAFLHSTEFVYHIHGGDREELIEKRIRGYLEPFAQPGDRIAFGKYTGLRVKGEDGVSYLLLNDEDITARVSEGVEFTDLDTRKGLGT